MSLNITDPATGKSYTFKGFTPARRVYEACTAGFHSDCFSGPQLLVKVVGFESAKELCCLCDCHFKEAN